MEVPRFQLAVDHLPRDPPMRSQRAEPRHDEPPYALARCQVQEPGRFRLAQHRRIGPVEPGIHDVLLFAEVLPDVVERDAERGGDIMQPHGFPRAILGERDGRIYDSVGFARGHFRARSAGNLSRPSARAR